MKTMVIIAAGVLTFNCADAQKMNEKDIPESVKAGFSKKYPSAKAEKWEKEGNDYEAEFDLNKVESSAVFDASGKFKELEQEIKISELPKQVPEYCTKNYAGYKLSEAAKIIDASDKMSYEAEMSKGKEHFDALFDQNGNFLKKGEVKTGKEDDKD